MRYTDDALYPENMQPLIISAANAAGAIVTSGSKSRIRFSQCS